MIIRRSGRTSHQKKHGLNGRTIMIPHPTEEPEVTLRRKDIFSHNATFHVGHLAGVSKLPVLPFATSIRYLVLSLIVPVSPFVMAPSGALCTLGIRPQHRVPASCLEVSKRRSLDLVIRIEFDAFFLEQLMLLVGKLATFAPASALEAAQRAICGKNTVTRHLRSKGIILNSTTNGSSAGLLRGNCTQVIRHGPISGVPAPRNLH